jgi:hypothetical protein
MDKFEKPPVIPPTVPPKAQVKDEGDMTEDVVFETTKQFIRDLLRHPKIIKKLIELRMETKFSEFEKLNNEDFKEFISGTPLNKVLNDDVENSITDAYEQIELFINRGDFPIITVPARSIQDLIENGISVDRKNKTYDNQKLIAGTIGRDPLSKADRFVCKIVNVKPNDIIPRSTGSSSSPFDFNFNGVIIFKHSIAPKNIEIISVPENLELPDKISLPVNAAELKKQIDISILKDLMI